MKLNRTGVDEAGRGSIIGPLVVAGVCANKETIKEFKKIGIKDSKKLTRKTETRKATRSGGAIFGGPKSPRRNVWPCGF